MYKRDFNKPPVSIIQNGKALFGTYKNVSQKLDIRGIHAPYAGIPLPSFISNLRIKSCLDYIFDLENYIGFVEFFDFKVFGFAIFVLWNKQNLKKYSYYTFMPTRKRFIPTVTSKGRCVSYNKKRYITNSNISFISIYLTIYKSWHWAKSIFNKIGLGKIIYLCIALKQLFETPRCNMELTIDNGETIKLDKCLFASVLNHKFQGGGLMFCPDALADDGVLDICYASGVSPFRVLTLLPLCYKGKHVGKKGIGIHTAKEVRIVSDIPLYVHTDGEVKTTATDITVNVLSGKLRFTV